MTKYFCDKCGAEFAHNYDMENVTFTMEFGRMYGEPTTIQINKDLCPNCLNEATKMFENLKNM